ncbi:SNF2 super family [Micromonas commoda]|uniref:SNF2 super family n=1 Tax=Micromonas commoda (strain RCC299 / NOUM17 / CCMP2709) TaxID=296587 RepID=C1FHF9_MICCC|nr:SNF2 super family [Micromonas commoda]ACO70093.1 SNF2 super family [Micromonas commoda]|eukprot:XP_002508835.1 SNF2 super family [Micromonas commoda]
MRGYHPVPKDARTRAAVVAAFGHARCDWASSLDRGHPHHRHARAGFCGVVGCEIHDASRGGPTGSLRGALERLRPRAPTYVPIDRAVAMALDAVLSRLDPRGCAAFASTCVGARQRIDCRAPGLKLRLHPHQEAGLAWMRARERPNGSASMPPLPDPRYWVNVLTGEMSTSPPPSYADSPGGLLCDEPGLGKTVTALALVLATRGARPAPPDGHRARRDEASGCWYYEGTARLAAAATHDGDPTTPSVRRSRRSTTPGVGHFAKIERAAFLLDNPRIEDDKNETVEDDPSLPPPGFRQVTASAARASKERAMTQRNVSFFQRAIAIASHNVGKEVAFDACEFVLMNAGGSIADVTPLRLPKFRFNGEALKDATWDPFAEPIALDTDALEEALSLSRGRARGGAEETPKIWLSSATLVILPPVLISHWLEQIAFTTGAAEDGPSVCVVGGAKGKSKGEGANGAANGTGDASRWLFGIEGEADVTDLGRHDSLSSFHGLAPRELANRWDLVIIPVNRLSYEFSRDSPILRVHWRRVVLDEGHQLGGASAITAKLSMACALRAHARWVMTGTPTPATLKGAGVGHLHPLLAFLRQAPYASSQQLWMQAIQRPLDGGGAKGGGGADAAARLGSLLRRVAIRTLKSDIRLPPLEREVRGLAFTRAHALSYNEIVSHVRRSLLLADWADPSHVESLLNPRQTRLAMEAVQNLREAACVTGVYPVHCFGPEMDETVEDLVEALKRRGHGHESATARANELRYPLTVAKGRCQRCDVDAFMPLVTPCGHLLCCGCVAVVGDESGRGVSSAPQEDFLHETRAPVRCPVCASPFKMQAPDPRLDNPAPRQAVPQDLIEIQPSYVQLPWKMVDALEAQGESTKVEYLLARLRELGAAPLEREKGAPGDGDDAGDLERLAVWSRRASGPPPKCIVYSGFRTHLDVIDLALSGAKVNFANIARIGMSRWDKDRALASFRADPDVSVLLLDRAAAEGLDLSFVQRVFVAEPLDNASLEQQVVSRAHRMGQRGTVIVEVLAMRGTAEETLLDVQAELAAAAHAAAEESRARKKREEDDDWSDEEEEDDEEEAVQAGVAPAIAAEALSRRRVLQTLKLIPVPELLPADDELGGGAGEEGAGGAGREWKIRLRALRSALAFFDSSLGVHSLSAGVPPRRLTGDDDDSTLRSLGVNDRDGKKNKLGSSDDRVAVGVGGSVGGDVPASAAAAEAAAAAIAGGGLGEGEGRQLTVADIDGRVARRTALHAARQAVSTAAMLDDPDGGDDDGGDGGAAARMAADLMRAAEASAARGSAADPTIASLQNAFRAIVQERAAEAEGNRKVSAAVAGRVTFQSLIDGRLVVRYSAPDVAAGRVGVDGEQTEIVQDLPAALLPLVLRVVAADQSPAARQNLAPAAMAVASPRVFWAIVRHGGVGGGDGIGFAEALERLAPGAADWASIAVRERRRPERYSEYVSH